MSQGHRKGVDCDCYTIPDFDDGTCPHTRGAARYLRTPMHHEDCTPPAGWGSPGKCVCGYKDLLISVARTITYLRIVADNLDEVGHESRDVRDYLGHLEESMLRVQGGKVEQPTAIDPEEDEWQDWRDFSEGHR